VRPSVGVFLPRHLSVIPRKEKKRAVTSKAKKRGEKWLKQNSRQRAAQTSRTKPNTSVRW